jgi:hypothetical protein
MVELRKTQQATIGSKRKREEKLEIEAVERETLEISENDRIKQKVIKLR